MMTPADRLFTLLVRDLWQAARLEAVRQHFKPDTLLALTEIRLLLESPVPGEAPSIRATFETPDGQINAQVALPLSLERALKEEPQ